MTKCISGRRIYEEALRLMCGTIENKDEEIELRDHKKQFFVNKIVISSVKITEKIEQTVLIWNNCSIIIKKK